MWVPKKGLILDKEIKTKQPKLVLELGTYCGYSMTRIARLLASDARVFSIDPNKETSDIAKQIVEHAGLSDKVVFLLGTAEEILPTLLSKYEIKSFDLIFLDHVKDRYLSDFQLIESLSLVQPGSVIVADNVIYPGAPDYLKYIRESRHYTTTFYEATLEYDDRIPDGVEVSVRK